MRNKIYPIIALMALLGMGTLGNQPTPLMDPIQCVTASINALHL